MLQKVHVMAHLEKLHILYVKKKHGIYIEQSKVSKSNKIRNVGDAKENNLKKVVKKIGSKNKKQVPKDMKQDILIKKRMDWAKISNCVEYELYPKLASVIKTIVNDNKMNECVITEKTVDFMIQTLKTKRNLAYDELCYLRELIQRAVDFNVENSYSSADEKFTENNST
eukprot:58542_1